MTDHPLDDPAGTSLRGAHAHLAEAYGRARRYPLDVSPFAGLPADAAEWDDLAHLVGPDGVPAVTGPAVADPPGWERVWSLPGVQLVDDGDLRAAPDADAVVLGPADVPEMLDLVARTRPGPFGTRTIEMGTYLGIRTGGRLVAMAGERLHPPGWTEISAVCTDPDHQGRGLATRLVHAVAAGIRARGDTPFLHTAASNTTAIRLYSHLGFRLRAEPSFVTFSPVTGNTTGPDGAEDSEAHPTPT